MTMATVFAGRHPETGAALCGRPGETVELPDGMASEFIAGGYAVAVESAKAPVAKEPVAATAAEENPSGPKGRHRTGRRAIKDK